jgi:hypothetical protein
MTKAFKKGERVTVINNWDSKGTAYVRHATVHSCGKKILRLTCDVTGDEFGNEFLPVVAAHGEVGVRRFIDGDSLGIEAMAVAISTLEAERKELTYCRDVVGPNAGHGYRDAIQQSIEALHEPRWEMYGDLLAAIRDRVLEPTR